MNVDEHVLVGSGVEMGELASTSVCVCVLDVYGYGYGAEPGACWPLLFSRLMIAVFDSQEFKTEEIHILRFWPCLEEGD